ncbi:MAG: NUDIX hydrolase [Verrucomicrobia bacterium]|nr:NUDIX hydrolase [Verrucomicrobiota bacterium]
MPTPNDPAGHVVFATPWFQVVSQKHAASAEPFYAIQSGDFVVIIAVDAHGRLLLVRQFRPVVGRFTLELPAGHVEPGETPEAAARKELCEETGYEAGPLELLAQLSPSSARFTNQMWIYFAANARPAVAPAHPRETGVDCVLHEGDVRALLKNPELFTSGTWAALLAAVAQDKLKL